MPNYKWLSFSYCKSIEVVFLYTFVFAVPIIYSDICYAHSQEIDEPQAEQIPTLTDESIKDEKEESEVESNTGPMIKDENIEVELVFEGTMNPTSMAFLDKDDILFLELFNGTVFRITNGTLQPEPVLDVNVSKVTGERGLLGISVSRTFPGHTYVFLYYTEANEDGGTPIGNRLYRYEFVDNKLVNPKLILDLPAYPGPFHNGGAITIGPDGNIYVPIGDLYIAVNNNEETYPDTQAQNIEDGEKPNGSGGIVRVTQDGQVVDPGILGDEYPLNLYYAYGIRNSFGIDFDPVTGKLWDTENGPSYGDEINLVEPGFNSGWKRAQGIWYDKDGFLENVTEGMPRGLVDFNRKGNYSSPELTWRINGTGVTAIKFFDSDKLGKQFENSMFVGDVHNGNLYHFRINENRTGLMLDPPLDDKVVDHKEELEEIILGQGFAGGITDIEVGEDGYLYILSGIWSNQGKIYRLIPTAQ